MTVQPGVMSLRRPVTEAPASPRAQEGTTPADVHVHIDRITVTRAAPAAPAPAAPAAPRGRAVSEHSAYLARRRERR